MVVSILFGHIVELCSSVWSNYVLLFSIMFGSLDWLPKFCFAGNYVGRFLDLWFVLLSFIPNFVRLYGIMFGKWTGASREETYGQSWDKYIFPRFSWFILIISSVCVLLRSNMATEQEGHELDIFTSEQFAARGLSEVHPLN